MFSHRTLEIFVQILIFKPHVKEAYKSQNSLAGSLKIKRNSVPTWTEKEGFAHCTVIYLLCLFLEAGELFPNHQSINKIAISKYVYMRLTFHLAS